MQWDPPTIANSSSNYRIETKILQPTDSYLASSTDAKVEKSPLYTFERLLINTKISVRIGFRVTRNVGYDYSPWANVSTKAIDDVGEVGKSMEVFKQIRVYFTHIIDRQSCRAS